MSGDKEGNYLTFELGSDGYGVPLASVREIVALMPITALPLAPDYVRGVINLRGHVIPVVDLRRRFRMAPTEDNDRTCIIICDVERGGKQLHVSFVVDAVCDVLHIDAAEIEDAPVFRSTVDASCVRGIAKTGTGVKLLLDVDELLGDIT